MIVNAMRLFQKLGVTDTHTRARARALPVVLRGGKGRMRRVPKHCCSANNAVERCCMLANAMEFVEKNGASHTHAHAHARTHTHAPDPRTATERTSELSETTIIPRRGAKRWDQRP